MYFRKFRISLNHLYTSTIRYYLMYSKVLNLFESLVDKNYKVLSQEFDVLSQVVSKLSNVFESLIDQHYKVLALAFDAL